MVRDQLGLPIVAPRPENYKLPTRAAQTGTRKQKVVSSSLTSIAKELAALDASLGLNTGDPL